MNYNGFNALCFDSGGYAQISWERPPEDHFSVCIQFLPDSGEEQGTLFALDSLLSVALSEGRICLRTHGRETVSEEKILPRCRNTVAAVCDGAEISVYCNGVRALRQAAPSGLAGITYLRAGENLSASCIYKITIFHRCLTQQEVHAGNVKKLTGFHGQINFTAPICDAGIALHKCRVENCVYTLACDGGKLSAPQAELPAEGTLSFSLYVFERENCGGTLLRTPHICIKLWDEYGTGRPKVRIECDGKPFGAPYAVPTNQWTDVTVAFGGGGTTVYFDGKFQTAITCAPSGGTGEIAFGPFGGYLDQCAIRCRAVHREEMPDYIKKIPDVFDRELLYYYHFSDRLWQESCSGTALVPEGARIILARGTDAAVRADKSRPGPHSGHKYSEFAQWQIHLLISLLVNWIYEWLGVYPNKGVRRNGDDLEIDENLYRFVYQEIACMKEAQILLGHYDHIVPEELLALIQAMRRNGTLQKLLDYLYQEDDEQDPATDLLLAMLAAAALAALLAVLDKAIAAAGPVPRPPKAPEDDSDDDDDDEKKKKKTYISIKQTSLKGGLRIDFDPKDMSRDDKATALYVRNSRTKAYLEITLSYRGDDGDFTVIAENQGGGVIPDAGQSVSFRGKNPVQISLAVHPQDFKKKYGKCTETLRWRCESKDGEQTRFLGESTYELYFLENEPCTFWGDAVHIECLELCAECAESAGENPEGFVRDYMRYIQSRDHGVSADQAGAAPHAFGKSYSKAPAPGGNTFLFDAVGFARDYRHKGHSFLHRDLVYSHAVFSCLNGHKDAQVTGLSANMSYLSAGSESVRGRLLIRDSSCQDGFRGIEDRVHYVLRDVDGEIYDAECGSCGLPFSDDGKREVTADENRAYYRESVYLPGSYCEIVRLIKSDNWKLGDLSAAQSPEFRMQDEGNALPQRQNVGWVRPRARGGYEHWGRADLDDSVKTHIHERDARLRTTFGFDTVCHSISAYEIDQIIAEICTNHRPDSQRLLLGLVGALYPQDMLGNNFTRVCHASTDRLARTLGRCLANNNPYADDVLLHFCRLAVNSPANLRLGSAKWNAALGEMFDPSQWFYYYDADAECVISERASDERCGRGSLLPTLYARCPGIPAPNEPGYYLPDRADGARISSLLALGLADRPHLKRKCICDPGGAYYPLVFSSGNQFPFHEGGDRYVEPPEGVDTSVFYLESGNGWRRLE